MDKPAKIVPSDPFAFLDEAALPSAHSDARPADAADWRARWRAWPVPLRCGIGAVVLSMWGAALGVAAGALSPLVGGPLLAGWAAAGIGAVVAVLAAPLVAWISAVPVEGAAVAAAAATAGSGVGAAAVPAERSMRSSTQPQMHPDSLAATPPATPPATRPATPAFALAPAMRAPAAPALAGARAGAAQPPPETRPRAAPAAATAGADGSDIRDALTGAYTQRYFIAAADREWSRIRRHGGDAALLMIDPDHLGSINDAHGMDCGDAALVQLARLVTATLRQYDLMARFNAGVLVLYLPHTDPIGAIDVAERIRDRIASHRMHWPTGTVTLTVSVGVAAVGADHAALDAVIGDAGAALRQAKAAGRNCVRASPVPPKRLPSSGAAQGDRRAH